MSPDPTPFRSDGERTTSRLPQIAAGTTRRSVLRRAVVGGLGVSLFGGPPAIAAARDGADDFGELQPADENGLLLPVGFRSRVVAQSHEVVRGTEHRWHGDPDGGATFATEDGGWVYVSNAERLEGQGGVGALRFDAQGEIVDAYSILKGTTYNCAGGPTPWGTWLSCEEIEGGLVYECDPFSPNSQGVARPALGRFTHEAATVVPEHEALFLTEDLPGGRLYRFRPKAYPDLTAGVLEAAEVLGPEGQPIQPGERRSLDWHVVPDPLVEKNVPTRFQVPFASPFMGGEGIWHHDGVVYFSTKGDNRVWRLHVEANEIDILYDLETSETPILSGVDNLCVAPSGDVLVAEDPGSLQIVALTPQGSVKPIVQLTGVSGTEIAGPALSPDGTRLYFSSQRNPGQTFEVTGPFLESPTQADSKSSEPKQGSLGGFSTLAAIAAAGAVGFARRQRDQ